MASSPAITSAAEAIAYVRERDLPYVRVGVFDIDGIFRGKYMSRAKFESAMEKGFGFCDVVYGWDSQDVCYDNTTLTGWHKGFPDAMAQIDLATHRKVPWDGGVDFFLASFVRDGRKGREPLPIDPRQVFARVVRRARKAGFNPLCSLEFEFFNFAETPQSWADKHGVDPAPRQLVGRRQTGEAAADDHDRIGIAGKRRVHETLPCCGARAGWAGCERHTSRPAASMRMKPTSVVETHRTAWIRMAKAAASAAPAPNWVSARAAK